MNKENQLSEEKLKHFAKKGFLLDKELLEFFVKLGDDLVAEQMLNQIVAITKSRLISKKTMLAYSNEMRTMFFNLPKEKAIFFENFFAGCELIPQNNSSPKEKSEEKKEIVLPNVKVLSSNIIPYKRIEVKDFVNHFRNRYNFIKDLLKNRTELNNLISLNKIGTNRNFSLIVMVSKKRITKNKNILLEIEDLTGRMSALVSFEKEELFEKAKEVVPDDVIGIKCSGGKEFVYINDIIFPEAGISEKKKCIEEAYSLFISDIHLGSKLFLEKNFRKFISWLNCEGADELQKEKIRKIKYLFVVGDNVDGVGVYPGQEALLTIKDIKNQYIELGKLLELIPKHITIILCPGQHDAVRVPEPQPPIDEEYAQGLMHIPNLILVSNPALIEIGCPDKNKTFKVLMYHGASMHGWIDEIDALRQGKAHLNPSKVVKCMLKHRHLSPMHSANVYVPSEKEDFLAIKEVPDIFVTGDIHRTDINTHNNILIICCSCWQSITPFEEKVGNQPDPCKVPMLNLKTREITILDFSGTEEKEENIEKKIEDPKPELAKNQLTNDKIISEVKK